MWKNRTGEDSALCATIPIQIGSVHTRNVSSGHRTSTVYPVERPGGNVGDVKTLQHVLRPPESCIDET